MKVKAKENLACYLTKDKEYPVLKDEDDLYLIVNDEGIVHGYFKRRFDVVIDSIFRVGDKVYNHICGWATVKGVAENYCVLSNENNANYGIDSGHLSFTEYTQTGFSQERPIDMPEIGEVCLISDDEINWEIRMFKGEIFKHCKRVKFL